jgi:predicted porin
MRNTKIALAVLALVASTAAMAQATVYGTLDAGMTNTSSSNNTTSGTHFSGTGGWVGGSNIGFKGSEDLENGMKATYQLQAGFNLGTGDVANGGGGGTSTLFSQISQVGLSSDMGTLTLGQQFSPYIGAQAAGTAGNGHFFVNRIILGSGDNALGNAAAGSTITGRGGFFIPNAISYTTPSIGGISATVLQGMRNGGGSNGQPEDTYTAASATGSFGDVNVTVGMQDRKNTVKGQTISVSYAMGPATLAGNYTKSDVEGSAPAVSSYSGSLSYKVTDPLTLSLQYARNNLTTAQTLSNVAAQYALSKRTSAYATMGRGANGAQSNYDLRGAYKGDGSVTTTSTTYAVGVVHNF